MQISAYTKSVVAVIAAGIAVLIPAIGDNHVDATEFVNVLIAIVTAVGVYFVRNQGTGANAVLKAIVAFSGAVLAALVNILGGTLGWADVTLADWLTVLLGGLSALGVYAWPNTDEPVDNSDVVSGAYVPLTDD